MRLQRLSLATALALSWNLPALAQHWGYSGEAGPENWSTLDPGFVMCGLGRNQSPVDLGDFVEAELEPLDFAYQAGAVDIVNNGHTVQVNYAPGSTLTVSGRAFELKQFHFHAPSENRIDGKQFPLEGHLVHADQQGALTVVAVMFQEGDALPLIAELWERMPAEAGGKAELPAGLSAAQLLPDNRDYYRFNGSLTTPPCSEGVWWLVMKEPVSLSGAQIDQFSSTLGLANNRPVQPVNARPILR